MPSKIALRKTTTPTSSSRERFRKALVACGPISALIYVGWAELAALRWADYSRITNAISELSLPEAPSAGFLQPWEFIAYHAFVMAFGIGVWQSARGSRPLRVIGGLQVLAGATFPLWLALGEVLVAHMVLSTVAVLAWLGSLGFGAAAFDKRFRLYSLITLAAVLVFNALAFMYVPEAAAGEAMGVIGLYERIAFSAYFMWVMVLAAILWPQAAGNHPSERTGGSSASTPILPPGMTGTAADAREYAGTPRRRHVMRQEPSVASCIEVMRGWWHSQRATTAFLVAGIASVVLYGIGDLVSGLLYDGYSFRDQAISELSAFGSPARPVMATVIVAHGLLVIAFGVGVWRAADRRSLRAVGLLLIAAGIVGFPTHTVFAMSSRWMQAGFNDTMHIAMTAVFSLFVFVALVLSAVAYRGWLRAYAIATLVTLMAFGAASSAAIRGIEQNLTPWAGGFERVNAYAYLAWLVVLSVTMIRRPVGPPASDGKAETVHGQVKVASGAPV